MGKKAPDQDWKRIFAIRKELRAKWEKGNLAAAYVEGHTDSVYCAQFDE
jgi:F-box and WD-40 domain protein 1/11